MTTELTKKEEQLLRMKRSVDASLRGRYTSGEMLDRILSPVAFLIAGTMAMHLFQTYVIVLIAGLVAWYATWRIVYKFSTLPFSWHDHFSRQLKSYTPLDAHRYAAFQKLITKTRYIDAKDMHAWLLDEMSFLENKQ